MSIVLRTLTERVAGIVIDRSRCRRRRIPVGLELGRAGKRGSRSLSPTGLRLRLLVVGDVSLRCPRGVLLRRCSKECVHEKVRLRIRMAWRASVRRLSVRGAWQKAAKTCCRLLRQVKGQEPDGKAFRSFSSGIMETTYECSCAWLPEGASSSTTS